MENIYLISVGSEGIWFWWLPTLDKIKYFKHTYTTECYTVPPHAHFIMINIVTKTEIAMLIFRRYQLLKSIYEYLAPVLEISIILELFWQNTSQEI